MQLQRAMAVLATELGIAINQRIGERLYLPERFISARSADAATFDFTFKKLFRGDNDFGGHVAFLQTDLFMGGRAIPILRCIGGFQSRIVPPLPSFSRKILTNKHLDMHPLS
jgi:hypothetical protein